ncbi:MAG TPA: MBL fold metallo-hydrolase, partial [Verrucomicrobiae bacterium]|nr:MBL fold metallo-hydrolase [Verrucomicrobiae bacterium]
MKTTFRPRLLNGQTGDPALLVSMRWQGRALLVDLGRIDRTPAATLIPIEAVFVSHTHMDHFMGFDQLLRLFLARDATLRLYGPAGLADCVAGKLAGYTWNLTDEYGFAVEVTEIGGEVTSWRFAARRRFAREPLGVPRPFDGVVLADPVLTV